MARLPGVSTSGYYVYVKRAAATSGLAALLRETSRIGHQHGMLIGQILHRVVTHDMPQRIGIPVCEVQKPLQRLGFFLPKETRPNTPSNSSTTRPDPLSTRHQHRPRHHPRDDQARLMTAE
jgi:hypothetical protein